MQYFNYKAIDSSGGITRGSVVARGIDDVDGKLATRGLELIVARPSRSNIFNARGTFTRKQLIDFTFHLHQMLEAGVPLIETLHEYRDSIDQKKVSVVVGELVEQIEAGNSLSDACSMQAAIFKPMYTSMLQAGEQSGRLVEVLSDLLALLKWQDETVSSLRRVLIYPAFVCLVLTVVIGFVMTWLVPSLTSFIASAGGELPWHTQWLISLSNTIIDHWFMTPLMIAVGLMGGSLLIRSSELAQLKWHALQLRLPLIGQVLYKIKLARFCRCAALMYASGINLIDTLRHGEAVVDNLCLAGAIHRARANIIAGESVTDAFRAQTVLPPLLSRLVRVGESTGGMDRAFLQTSYFYDRDSREAIERLEQFIGPVLIIIVGTIMMWVVLSVIGPIYDLVFSMQGSM